MASKGGILHDEGSRQGSGNTYSSINITGDARVHLGNAYNGEPRIAYKELLLDSLSMPNLNDRKNMIRNPAPNTFEWIYENDERQHDSRWSNFAEWLQNGSFTYWISGKAGSGKSTLMGYIVDNYRTTELLRSWRNEQHLHVLSFFFWRAGAEMHKSTGGLLRSLLYQICQRLTDKAAQDLFKIMDLPDGGDISWSERTMLQAMKAAVSLTPDRCYCIFIDGLDEYVGDQNDLVDLVETLDGLRAVKCCVSSRPEVLLKARLSSYQGLRLQDFNYWDILNFVDHKLGRHNVSFRDQQTNLVSQVVERAEGVFLWAAVVTEKLVRGWLSGDDYEVLHRHLISIPTEMNELFKHMASTIEPSHRNSLAFYLNALKDTELNIRLCRLSIAELTCARLAREIDSEDEFQRLCLQTERQILGQSAGLLELYETDDRRLTEGHWEMAHIRIAALGSHYLHDRGVAPNRSTVSLRSYRRRNLGMLHPYPSSLRYETVYVQWVHRSAYDFLLANDVLEQPLVDENRLKSVRRCTWRGRMTYLAIAPWVSAAEPESAEPVWIHQGVIASTRGRIDRLMGMLESGHAEDDCGMYSTLDELRDVAELLSPVECSCEPLATLPDIDGRYPVPDFGSHGIIDPTTSIWFAIMNAEHWTYIWSRLNEIDGGLGGALINTFLATKIADVLVSTTQANEAESHDVHDRLSRIGFHGDDAEQHRVALQNLVKLLTRVMRCFQCRTQKLKRNEHSLRRSYLSFYHNQSISYIPRDEFETSWEIEAQCWTLAQLVNVYDKWRLMQRSQKALKSLDRNEKWLLDLEDANRQVTSILRTIFQVTDLTVSLTIPPSKFRTLALEVDPAFANRDNWVSPSDIASTSDAAPARLEFLRIVFLPEDTFACDYPKHRTFAVAEDCMALHTSEATAGQLVSILNKYGSQFTIRGTVLERAKFRQMIINDIWAPESPLKLDEKLFAHRIIEDDLHVWSSSLWVKETLDGHPGYPKFVPFARPDPAMRSWTPFDVLVKAFKSPRYDDTYSETESGSESESEIHRTPAEDEYYGEDVHIDDDDEDEWSSPPIRGGPRRRRSIPQMQSDDEM